MPAVDVATDNYSPACVIKIANADLDPLRAHSILRIKVEQELNKANAFTIEFQDELTGGNFRIFDRELFKIGKEVAIELGYVPARERVMLGSIKNISASFQLGTSPTFTIEGVDIALEKLTAQGECRAFESKRDSDIVKEIARELKLKAEVETTPIQHATKLKRGGESYLKALEDLAKRNGFEFELSDGVLRFGKMKKGKDVVARFGWGKNLMSFQPRLNTAESVTEVVVRGWDSNKKRMIEARVKTGKEETEDLKKQRSSEAASEFFGSVVRVITDRPVRSVEEAEKIAKSEMEQAGYKFLRASAVVIGNPKLRPGLHVDVDGLGEIFSGRYSIDSTVHECGEDGYKTTLELKRNAI